MGEVLYFTVVPADAMEPVDRITGPVRMIASVKIGEVRLMDNIGVEPSQ